MYKIVSIYVVFHLYLLHFHMNALAHNALAFIIYLLLMKSKINGKAKPTLIKNIGLSGCMHIKTFWYEI